VVNRKVRSGQSKKKHIEKRCPFESGDELEVNITDVSPSGDGMSKIQGYVIMVPNAKPRDRVKIKLTRVDKKTATGEIIK